MNFSFRFELLNMLKFCLSKYELVMIKSLKENLENYDNICGIDEDVWETFGKSEVKIKKKKLKLIRNIKQY